MKHQPVFGLFPSNQWQKGELVRDEVFWLAPKDMQSGSYAVSAALGKGEPQVPERSKFIPLFEFEYK